MKKFLSLLLALCLSLSLLPVTASAATTPYSFKSNAVTSKKHNAYAMPNINAKQWWYTDKNDKVEVLCKDGDYYLLLYPFNNTGLHILSYVPTSAVKLNSGVTVKSAADRYQNIEATVNKATTLRHFPATTTLKGASGDNVTERRSLAANEAVKILFERDGFYCIRTKNDTGFVKVSEVTVKEEETPVVVDPPTPPEPTPPEPTPPKGGDETNPPKPTPPEGGDETNPPEPTPPEPEVTPTLEAPAKASVTADKSSVEVGKAVKFSWKAATGASTYDLHIYQGSTRILLKSGITALSTSHSFSKAGTYTVYVASVNDSTFTPGPAITIKVTAASSFSPRTTAPKTDNAYYYSNKNIFYASKWSPPFSYKGNKIKGNCTWYAWGRAYEILGKTPGSELNGNAYKWWAANKKSGRYNYGSQPKVGAIVVWKPSDSNGGCGHVAIVEKIVNGKVYISESSWLNVNYKYRQLSNTSGIYGYIYILEPKNK